MFTWHKGGKIFDDDDSDVDNHLNQASEIPKSTTPRLTLAAPSYLRQSASCTPSPRASAAHAPRSPRASAALTSSSPRVSIAPSSPRALARSSVAPPPDQDPALPPPDGN